MITDLARPEFDAASARSRSRSAKPSPAALKPPTRINSRRVNPSHSFVPRPNMLSMIPISFDGQPVGASGWVTVVGKAALLFPEKHGEEKQGCFSYDSERTLGARSLLV